MECGSSSYRTPKWPQRRVHLIVTQQLGNVIEFYLMMVEKRPVGRRAGGL